jgi:hypothetical protein
MNSPLKRIAEVNVVQAVGTSVAQSSSDWQQPAQRAAPVQAHDVPQQQPAPAR